MVFACVRTEYADKVRVAVRTHEEDELRRMMQNIDHSFEVFRSWCSTNNGTIVRNDFADSVFEVPVSALVDLQKLMTQFRDHTDLDTFAGVGNTIEEAESAADVAEQRRLDHPVLMTEQLNESLESSLPAPDMSKAEEEFVLPPVPDIPHESQYEPLDKGLKQNIGRALRGLGVAAMLASRGNNPQQLMDKPPIEEVPEWLREFVGPQQVTAPLKMLHPQKHDNPYYRHTFLEQYNPHSVHLGMHDGLWAIVHAESNGGKMLDHGDGFNEKTGHYKPELHSLFIPQKRNLHDSDREVRDNRAWGPYGMRPYTAMETYHKDYNSTKFKMGEGELSEKQFLDKFKKDLHFHNEVVKHHVDHLVEKFKPQMKALGDPLIPFRAYHHGDQKAALPHIMGEKKSDYDALVLRSINQGLKAGREFDFTPMFGNDAWGRHMGQKLIDKARMYSPPAVAKQPKDKKKAAPPT